MKLIGMAVTTWNGQKMNGDFMVLNTESIVYAQEIDENVTEIVYYDLADGVRPIKVVVPVALTTVESYSNQLLVVPGLNKENGMAQPFAGAAIINLDRIIMMTGLDADGGDDSQVGGPYEMIYDESRTNTAGMNSPFSVRYTTENFDMEAESENMVALTGNFFAPSSTEGGVAIDSLNRNGVDIAYPAGTLAWFGIKRVSTAFAKPGSGGAKCIVKFKGDKIGFTYLTLGIGAGTLVSSTVDIQA